MIVGTTAPGIYDLRPTPFGGIYPGMEILATAVDNLVHGDHVRPVSAAVTVGWILALSLLAGLGTTLLKKIWHLGVLLLAVLALPACAAWLAFKAGAWLDFAAPLFAVLGGFITASLLNYGVEGRQRRFIKSVFRFYLSPDVIDRVLENPGLLKLGGERREITAFFSDLAGFTSISEGLSPEALVGLLNAYLSEMTDIILGLGGTLDKYEGDAIIAFWNSPARPARPRPPGLSRGPQVPEAAGRAPRGIQAQVGPRSQDEDRPQLRPRRRGQHGLGEAVRLHGHGRHDEPGLEARRRLQGVQDLHARQRGDGVAGRGRDRDEGSGHDPRRRQETAHPHLRAHR